MRQVGPTDTQGLQWVHPEMLLRQLTHLNYCARLTYLPECTYARPGHAPNDKWQK
jgi:hypothetical protein